jgi:hypothetical protein
MDVFLAHASQPWRRGVNDCYLAVADQIHAWTGIDLMAGCRGFTTYHGMLRLVRKAGYADPFEAMADRLKQARAKRVMGPFQNRDIGLVRVREDGHARTVPALFYDGFWHVRGHGGWIALDAASAGVTDGWRL